MALRDFFAGLLGQDEPDELKERDDGLTFVQYQAPLHLMVPDPEPVTWEDYVEARNKAYFEGGLVSEDSTPLDNERSLAEIYRAAIDYGVFELRTASPPEEPEPWQERFIARDDGGLTDTTTGEITYVVEAEWQPLPEPEKPELYLKEVDLSEDGRTGEFILGYTTPTQESVGWSPLGTFGPDIQEDNQEEDDDKDDAGGSWRLF